MNDYGPSTSDCRTVIYQRTEPNLIVNGPWLCLIALGDSTNFGLDVGGQPGLLKKRGCDWAIEKCGDLG